MTYEQIRAIVEQALDARLLPWWYTPLLILLALAIVWGLSAYVRPYLGSKAERAARDEDIARILEELRRTTKLTEEIKSQIGGELWLQQRRWEFKVDAYKRLLEHLNDAASALRHLEVINAAREVLKAKGSPPADWMEATEKDYDIRSDQAFNGMRNAGAFAPVFLGDAAREALQELVREWGRAQREERDYYKFSNRLRHKLMATSRILEAAAREDLKLRQESAGPAEKGGRRGQ